MATDRDVYQVIHTQTFSTETFRNVYFYQRAPLSTAESDDLSAAFLEDVVPGIRLGQPPVVVTSSIAVKNLFNPVDQFEDLVSLAGQITSPGDELPPFVAAGWTLERETGATRNGKKRIHVGGEAYQDIGIWSGAMLTIIDDIADLLDDVISTSLGFDWFPVIVGRIEESEDVYRLPETQAEATVNGIGDASYSIYPTTQNSRKWAVGE